MNDARIDWYAREDGFGHIRLKAGPLNVLATGDLRALRRALKALDGCAAILLDAHGDRAFSAGVAVEDHLADRAEPMLEAFSEVALAFADANPTIVCAVGAPAIGGGFELVLLADIAICSTTAAFALPEVQLGALPPVACALLSASIGERRAFDLILTGKRIDARTALDWGVVSELVEPDRLNARALEICTQLLSYSRDALFSCKRALRANGLRDAMDIYRNELLRSADAAEGIKAFLEKRRPIWERRRSSTGASV